MPFYQSLAVSTLLWASQVSAFAPASRSTSSIGRVIAASSILDGNNNRQRKSSTRLFMSTRNNKTRRDFYKILGIARNADAEAIKSAYRRLAKQWHPDANPTEDTTDKFQDINRAYEVLKDPYRKQKYDLFQEDGEASPGLFQGSFGQFQKATAKRGNRLGSW